LVKETFLSGLKIIRSPGEVYKPINLLILDFQMPMKNGLQVVQEVKKFLHEQAQSGLELVIEEPTYVFLTAFATTRFVHHAQSLGV
jgi:YesN/AraC family two-component response regulator